MHKPANIRINREILISFYLLESYAKLKLFLAVSTEKHGMDFLRT